MVQVSVHAVYHIKRESGSEGYLHYFVVELCTSNSCICVKCNNKSACALPSSLLVHDPIWSCV